MVGKDEKSSGRYMFTLTIRMESEITMLAVKKRSRKKGGIGTRSGEHTSQPDALPI